MVNRVSVLNGLNVKKMYTTCKGILSPETKQTVCNNEMSALIRCPWNRVWLKKSRRFQRRCIYVYKCWNGLVEHDFDSNHRISSNVLKLQIPYTVHVQGKDYFHECLGVHVPPLGLFTRCSAILKFCPYPRVAMFQKLFWPPVLSSQKKLTELLVN